MAMGQIFEKSRLVLGYILMSLVLIPTVLTTQPSWNASLLVLAGVIVVLAIFCVFYSKQLGAWKVGKVDVLVLVWWLYILVRAYLQTDIPVAREVVTATLLFALYVALRYLRVTYTDGEFRLSDLLLIAVTYELLLGIWQLVGGTSLHYRYPVTGSFFNPGPYSAYIAVGMVMAISKLKEEYYRTIYRWQKALYVFVIVVGCLMLGITQSRAAIVAVVGMTLLTFKDELDDYFHFIILFCIIGGGFLLWLKMGSAMGRMTIWHLSISSLLDHFLVGSGIGSFPFAYGQELDAVFANLKDSHFWVQYADVTDYAFSDLCQLAVEQGVIGVLLGGAIFVLSLIDTEEEWLLDTFLALCVFSLFSYPFQLLPFQILAVVFVSQRRIEYRHLCALRPLHILGVCALAICCVLVCWNVTKPRLEAKRAYQQIAGLKHASFIPEYYKLLPNSDDNPNFLFNFAKVLQSNGRYNDSNAMLEKGMKKSNDPMFLVLMGNNYLHMDQAVVHKALEYYDKAFTRMPNRIYPLYLKMKYYLKDGNDLMLEPLLWQMRFMEPKVPSKAVDDMKEEARKQYDLLQQRKRERYERKMRENREFWFLFDYRNAIQPIR